ncbi:MAG TPA: secondary thiamine-phosphate synthase enzyme YjbQ [Pseudomonadales bacterium]|nr:secondary thiamine-phosphate synthase enzyme YjbQ [Pseudomonadales bacterium]
MMTRNTILRLEVSGQGLHEITSRVRDAVDALRAARPEYADDGLVTLFLRHTSASLLIQENADPSARRDLEAWLARLVPEGDALYTHTLEGPDDMPAHLRAALTATQLAVPLVDGELALGTWQGLYLWEHRRAGGRRELVVHLGA